MSQDRLNEQLFWAAINGNIEQVKSAINQGADVNYHHPFGYKWTPLHVAAENGKTEVVTFLITKGANPNAVDKYKRTPLHYATSTEVVTVLITKGANLNAVDENKWTPLHWAANNGNSEVATILINNGANPNAVTEFKDTPLHVAARNGKTKVVTVLINKGANPNAVDKYNRTPLHWAAYNGYSDIAHTLIKAGASLDAINIYGNTPLHDACSEGEIECIKLLLSNGADTTIKNNEGKEAADKVQPDDKNRATILHLIEEAKKDYSKLLDKALDEGKITAKYSKMAMSGAPGTGKSSVMKLLLNQPPPESHHSTPVTTTPEIRKVETTSVITGSDPASSSTTQFWGKVDRSSFKNMLARTVKNMLWSTTSESITPPVHNDESESSSDDDGSQDSSSSVDKPQSGEVTSRKSPSPAVSATTTEFVKMLPIVEESPELYNTHWIHCIDSGGQAAFLDIAPALLRYNPVSILTQKLNENLDDHPKFYFSFKGQQLGIPVERQITNLQLLESSFRSLASIDQPDLRKIHVKYSHLEPSLLVLGTYYDKIEECVGESLEEKNARLWSTLNNFQEVRINYCENEKQIIFPVNTTARGESEKKIAEKIRTIVCQSFIEAEIPIRWYLFQLELYDLQENTKLMVVSKKKCLKIGLAIRMNGNEVEAALMYYHDMTIFLYFPAVLPDVVFLHPQPLFNKLSEIISISITDATTYLDELNIVLPPNAHAQLKTEGIFTRDLLDCLPEGFSLDFTADDFLKLMEDILIIAPLPEKGKFFIPCVLPTTSKLENIISSFTEVTDALVLIWDMKPVPQGIFPALAVNLTKRPKLPTFSLHQPPTSDEPSEVLLQYRNAIQLSCLDLGGAVLLVDAIYSLDVYYSGPSKNCSAIRNALLGGIGDIVKKFQYKPILSSPQDYFYCSICSSSDHLCLPDDKKEILTCCRNPRLTASIDHLRQLPWIAQCVAVGKLQLQDNKPEKNKLLMLLSSVNAKWQEIGDLLGVDSNTIDGLCFSNYSDQVKMSKMLQSWLDNEPTPATWGNIISVIEGPLQNTSVANEMYKFVGIISDKKIVQCNISCLSLEQIFENVEYGVKLVIPPFSVKNNQEIVTTVQIVDSNSSDIKLPQGVQLVSCLYEVEASGIFVKPIELHLQHNVDIMSHNDSKRLVFITSDGPPPYCFKIAYDEQYFGVKYNYGFIKVSHFTKYGIAWLLSLASNFFQPTCSYTMTLFYKKFMKYCWQLKIVITQNLGPFQMRVKNDDSFQEWMKRDPFLFYFNPDVNYVSLQESTSECYIITPICEPNQVRKDDVDQSQPDSALLYLHYEVRLKEKYELTDLVLRFKGMKEEGSITLPCYELYNETVNKLEDTNSDTECQGMDHISVDFVPEEPILISSSLDSSEQQNDKLKVSKPERHVLLRLLYPIYGKWQEIGDLLGVDADIIETLSTSTFSNQVKMSKMLQSWLDNELTPTTWDNILDVIEGPLQKKKFADEIREKLKISKIVTPPTS